MSPIKLPIYQIDAFTSQVFSGNPAAVCPLPEWLPEPTMQAIAAENNLAETAFFVKNGENYELRWFTPTVEVDLCGHATLASGYVIFNHLITNKSSVNFHSKSGILRVSQKNGLLYLDFPAWPPTACQVPQTLSSAVGEPFQKILAARDYLMVFEKEEQVRNLKPDFEKLGTLDKAVIATAPGKDCDFVSRFFAPTYGIPEDPATGSAHCTLIPYWSKRLNKKELIAHQLSARGGELFCRDKGERVEIGGKAVLYMRGEIYI